MKLRTLLLALAALPAFATTPQDNTAIVPGGDGRLYSRFLDGNVDPPPPYEALHFDLGTTLSDCGILTMVENTPFTCEVRSKIDLGTNKLTAPITISAISGDDPEDNGATAPGTGDNLDWDCIGDASGVIQLCADDGTSSDCSTSKSWACTADPGTPPIAHDNVIINMGFESGAFNAQNTKNASGIYVDSARIQLVEPKKTFTITGCNKASPMVCSFTGAVTADFTAEILNGAYTTAGNTGWQIGSVSGMTELSNTLKRCIPGTITGGGTGCSVEQDGNDDQSSDGNTTLGDHNTNSSSYGTFSGTATATLFQQGTYNANNSLGTASTRDVHITTGVTPPSNLNGTASAFGPRAGNYFLTTVIDKTQDYSVINGQSSKDKARWTVLHATTGGTGGLDGGSDFAAGEMVCLGASVALPSNYDHNDRGTVNPTEDHMLRLADANAQDEAIAHISIIGTSSLTDHINLTYDRGTHDTNATTGTTDVDLGPVTNLPGIGTMLDKWTDFLIKMKVDTTGSTGYLGVWARTANSSGGSVGSWVNLFLRQNAKVGHANALGFRTGLRSYKYSWKHKADTTPSLKIWKGFDEYYFTRFTQDGGTCADVTVDGSDPTP